MKNLFSLLTVAILIFSACGTKKVIVLEDDMVMEERQLDTLFVTAPPLDPRPLSYELPVYNSSQTRTVDLLHTKLDLSFDWEKEQVLGVATLDLKPYFYATNHVVLDAKGFKFNSVTLGDGTSLKYEYDDQQIDITLPRIYQREDRFTLIIDYVATPSESGGSAAITSDKGLFFINPRGEEGDKPMQIWTQGETENNSRWFPTVDKPNERCTQEMYVTVDDRFKTLSNGLLISSEENGDGTRTDYWKMDLPHAPYLFMLAVGEFALVADEPWNGKPVEYLVEEEYEAYAKDIYPHTPEMLTFFSDITGVEYPWQKYSQVIVRDYVSGAMENTTGVIFGDFMYGTDRELIDVLLNDKIVAHEMFHHWFGDLVTCESWANLTLNEGFANYSEYLWLEHHFGKDEADLHMMEEWQGYFSSVENGGMHPLIHYGYDDKEDMFDAHSYNKGGSILHMLRSIIGDDAFFASLKKYLEDNAYSAVEVDELRMAFEETTGQDMHWFFDQWFHNQGHPVMEVDYEYGSGKSIVNAKQTQDGSVMPGVFQLPIAIDIYYTGQSQPERVMVMMNQREQSFELETPTKPALIIFDAQRSTLSEISDNKSPDQLAFQLTHAPHFRDRLEAIKGIPVSHPDFEQLMMAGLKDPFHGIRFQALNRLDVSIASSETKAVIAQMTQNDSHSEVRANALRTLTVTKYEDAKALNMSALDARPYNVVAAGLAGLYQIDAAAGLQAAEKMSDESNDEIITTIGEIYASEARIEHLPYFEQNLKALDGFNAINFFESYGMLLLDTDDKSAIEKAAKQLKGIGTNMGQSPWRRIAAIKTLSELNEGLASDETTNGELITSIQAAIDAIKAAETNPQLKSIYQQF